MRSYMAKKCSIHFPFNRKIERFLTASMRIFKVPEEEQQEVIAFVSGLDLKAIATEVLQNLFESLEMKYDFKLSPETEANLTIQKNN